MYPLVIASDIGEVIDPLLSDLKPVADADLQAGQLLELVYAIYYSLTHKASKRFVQLSGQTAPDACSSAIWPAVKPSSVSTWSVCSPSRGARCRTEPGVSLSRTGVFATGTGPAAPGTSTLSINRRASTCG